MYVCMYVCMNEYASVHVIKVDCVVLDRPGRWNSASWSQLHTMWTMVAKNGFLSSVQHNPLAHHRQGEEEEEEGGRGS